MTIHVNILLELGVPLRRTYVEHLVLGVGTGMYMTNIDGDVYIETDAFYADLRIICQNPIVRVRDGTIAPTAVLTMGAFEDVPHVTNGQQIRFDRRLVHNLLDFHILHRAEVAYQVVFHPLSFFRSLPSPGWPLGLLDSLRATRDQGKRIDLSYPDAFLASVPTTFTEPKRLGDGFPLIHIMEKDYLPEALGGPSPTLIPHELAHAIHFSMLTEDKRGYVQDSYLSFIAESLGSGGTAGHNFNVKTTPMVAFIEAGAFFSQQFSEFVRGEQGMPKYVRVQQIDEALQVRFVEAEWLRLTRAAPTPPSRLPRIAVTLPAGLPPARHSFPLFRPSRLVVLPEVMDLFGRPDPNGSALKGGDVEGAVYAAIFVDFAGVAGLDLAASAYFGANATDFSEYQEFINWTHPEHAEALEQARVFWGL